MTSFIGCYTKPPTRNIKHPILAGFVYAYRLTIGIYKRREIIHLLVSKSVLGILNFNLTILIIS